MIAVADHHHVRARLDAEFAECERDHVGLRAPPGTDVDRGPGLDRERIGETEMFDDAHRGVLGLRGGEGEDVAGLGERRDHLGDPWICLLYTSDAADD